MSATMTSIASTSRCSLATIVKPVILATSLLLSSVLQTVHAQDSVVTAAQPTTAPVTVSTTAEPTVCSCSPTVFTFVLSLDQNCDNNDIMDNTGIEGSFCFLEEGVNVQLVNPEPEPAAEKAADASSANVTATNATARADNDGLIRYRSLQDAAATNSSDAITEVVSVQFLEFDTSGDLTVINQDDTYADVSLVDGDRMRFESASSFLDTSKPLLEQASNPALVPGGASLILFGKTAGGKVVRNRFVWIYDMNCGRDNEPVKVGDEIGWVTVGETSNAWPAFCPALPPGSPTISPKTNEPTLSPSVSPIKSPTKSPTIAPTPRTSKVDWWGSGSDAAMFAKAHKASKTPKMTSKSSKSKSSKSKGGKGAKSWNSSEDGYGGHDVMGKQHKQPEGYQVYDNTGRVTGFEMEKANGGVCGRCGSGYGLALTLMASYLYARQ